MIILWLVLLGFLQQDPEIAKLLATIKPHPTYVTQGIQVDLTCPEGCPITVIFTKLPRTNQIMVYSLSTKKHKSNIILLRLPKNVLDVKFLKFLNEAE